MDEMTGIDHYTREYLRQYEEDSFELRALAVRRMRVLNSVRKYPHARMLEVGCGAEPLFPLLEDWERYTVVEPSAEFVRRARKTAAQRPTVQILEGYFEDVAAGLHRESFDFVVASSLLHEVADPSAFLKALRRLCTSSTTVHINVPNVYSFHRLLALEMGLIGSVFERSATEARFQRHTRFDRESFVKIVEEHGFRVLHFETYLVKPLTHDQMSALLKHGIIDGATIAGLDAMAKHLPHLGSEMFIEAAVRP